VNTIDLRSDTVTLPTQAMREAIYHAELGDDVFGEDPTTNRLEKIAAECTGKEAAIMVASGTMGNLVCVLSHCRRGEEVILGDQSHTFLYEAGGMSAVGGIHPHTVVNQPDGTIRLEDIEAAIRGNNVHFPRSRLICLENTHNRCYGSVLTPQYTESRKVLGGGMRQSGIIAAAGIAALEQMVDRLAEDHENAKRLAEGIARIPGLSIELNRIQTNIVYFDVADDRFDAGALVKQLVGRGVKILQVGPGRLRAVTHYGINAEDIDLALAAMSEVMAKS